LGEEICFVVCGHLFVLACRAVVLEAHGQRQPQYRQKAAALRDFNPGFDRFGSLATNRPARDAGGMSALTGGFNWSLQHRA